MSKKSYSADDKRRAIERYHEKINYSPRYSGEQLSMCPSAELITIRRRVGVQVSLKPGYLQQPTRLRAEC